MSQPKNPAKVMAGRIGAHKSWQRTANRTARTEPARRAFFEKFLREVDAETPGLLESERIRRAESKRAEYYARLTMRSAQARRGRKAGAADGR